MNKTNRNLILAFLALVVSISFIGITFQFRCSLGWWAFADCFALFMTCFTWLMSIVVGKIIPHSGKILQKAALVFAILFVIALIAEFIVYQVGF